MGYGRDDAVGAIDRISGSLPGRTQRRAQKTPPISTLPKSAKEVDLPDGYLKGRVKEYLKSVTTAPNVPTRACARQRHQRARRGTRSALSTRTRRSSGHTRLPCALSDKGRRPRPRYRNAQAAGGDQARCRSDRPTAASRRTRGLDGGAQVNCQESLDGGGAAMLSFHHRAATTPRPRTSSRCSR